MLELSREYYSQGLKEEAVPVKAIKNIPAADVATVKYGKWYTKSMTRRGGHGEAYFVYGCSLCKKKIRYKTDFCPNCGATMDGRT